MRAKKCLQPGYLPDLSVSGCRYRCCCRYRHGLGLTQVFQTHELRDGQNADWQGATLTARSCTDVDRFGDVVMETRHPPIMSVEPALFLA